jgi:hypothetical protein
MVYVCIQKRDDADYLIHISKDYDEFKSFFKSQPDKEKYTDSSYEFRAIPDESWDEFLSIDEASREFFEKMLK